MEKKRIAVLGSTGSIGKQALEVVDAIPDQLEVEVLAANNNVDLLIEQAKKYKPNAVVIVNESKFKEVSLALENEDIKVFAGSKSLIQIVEMETIDVVLAAIVGFAGLESTLNAIKHKKPIALANKETLVVAGDLVTRTAFENGVNIYPVDSEHSAIFQCLAGEFENPIEKIILTASGGPFRGMSKSELENVTKAQALKHPNWSMGSKITIDSATMMNKGLEVIEAKWLFNLRPNQIDVIVHPQSIVHSLVQFQDGSIKAQLGLPDMKLPIQYALTYPARIQNQFKRFDFTDYAQFNFEKVDTDTFRCLKLAFDALNEGDNMPCVLNAANEIAVDAFLNDKIAFHQIPDIVERTLNKVSKSKCLSLEDYLNSDDNSRKVALSFI
ncbi:MAG: 1-deoxy-D-xylulose-5-phosphate reductoisomerase [Bacteroidia bacterium]